MVQLMPLHAETPSSIVSFKLRLIRLEGCELTCCWFISPPAVLLLFKKTFLEIAARPIISTSTGPIFTKFARLVELWP